MIKPDKQLILTPEFFKYLLCFFLLGHFSQSNAQTADLTLIVSNIMDEQGNLVIAIYNERAHYAMEGFEFRKYILKVSSPTIKHVVKDLPLMEYAIAIYHDRNSDGKCNRNLIGIPIEAYGFSKNVRPLISKPSFKKTKFKLSKSKSMTISLIQ